MAKTLLMRSIRRLFADFRAAKKLGLPLHALREMRAERAESAPEQEAGSRVAVSRRELLIGAAAGAAVLGLPKITRATGGPSIAIVGGGIAGLTCARELLDAGIASTVYEASGRVGGRMFTNDGGYWAGGQISEWGGELIDTGHRTIRRLARRFDLPLDNLLNAQPSGSEDTNYFFGGYYTQAEIEADFEPVFDAITVDEEATGYPTTFDSYTAAGIDIDAMSVRQYIDSRVPGGYGSPLGRLLDNAYAGEYAADTTDQSALNLLYLLAYQPHPHRFSTFGESDEAFHIRGGNQRLPRAIADSLGSSVRTGHSLTRIRRRSDGKYRLDFTRSGASSVEVIADYVVLAIPFAVLRDIDYSQAGFDDLKNEAIRHLGRGHASKLQLQYSDRHWTRSGPWGIGNGSGYSDTGYVGSWEVTRAQSGTRGIQVYFSGGSAADAMRATTDFATAAVTLVRRDAEDALPRVERVLPGITPKWGGKATQSLPHKSPFFKSAYCYYRVGQYTTFGGYEKKRQQGVYFCGEHTSTDFQGFMEGGASEGSRVADKLQKRIAGRPDADD